MSRIPVDFIHADGTDCLHEGKALAPEATPGGPVCAGGLRLTHVRVNGKVAEMSEAGRQLGAFARRVAGSN